VIPTRADLAERRGANSSREATSIRRTTQLLVVLILVSIVLIHILAPQTASVLASQGGTLSEQVYGYNMYDQPMPLVWARVSAYKNGILVESVSTGHTKAA